MAALQAVARCARSATATIDPASALTNLGAYRNDGQDQELVDQHLTAALQTKGRAIAPPGAMLGATRNGTSVSCGHRFVRCGDALEGASTIGTAIEWYDFFLYSTVTGLVFAKLFFPNSDPWVG